MTNRGREQRTAISFQLVANWRQWRGRKIRQFRQIHSLQKIISGGSGDIGCALLL
jgi:hypothetical protein